MKKLLLLFLSSLPIYSLAGGSFHPIAITYFHHNKDRFHFIAKTSIEWKWMDEKCKEITVNGEYDEEKWFRSTNLINEDEHMEAISFLAMKAKNNEEVFFGYIGTGLYKVKECNYLSKGLVYFDNNRGWPYVLSIHNKI